MPQIRANAFIIMLVLSLAAHAVGAAVSIYLAGLQSEPEPISTSGEPMEVQLVLLVPPEPPPPSEPEPPPPEPPPEPEPEIEVPEEIITTPDIVEEVIAPVAKAPKPTPRPSPPPKPKPVPPKPAVSRSPQAPKPQPAAPARPAAPDTLPGIMRSPPPPYPEEARRRQWQGTVLLRAQIDARGNVTSVLVARSSGYGSLDQSALQTVRRSWRFRPATAGGIPVSSTAEVPVTFRLR